MMGTFEELLSKPDLLLGLEPEQLAGPLMMFLAERLRMNPRDQLMNLGNFFNSGGFILHEVPQDVRRACMEAWSWLEREGMLAPDPDNDGWRFVTRKGRRLAESGDFSGYRHSTLLPKQSLHPLIEQKVWSAFIRGEYDSAVFEGFKQVEISVRTAGRFSDTDYGVGLMRDAFRPATGPLTNKQAPTGEQQALSDLFAGAIGSYKNRIATVTFPSLNRRRRPK